MIKIFGNAQASDGASVHGAPWVSLCNATPNGLSFRKAIYTGDETKTNLWVRLNHHPCSAPTLTDHSHLVAQTVELHMAEIKVIASETGVEENTDLIVRATHPPTAPTLCSHTHRGSSFGTGLSRTPFRSGRRRSRGPAA